MKKAAPKALTFMELLFQCRHGLESERHVEWAPNLDLRHGKGSPEEVPLKLTQKAELASQKVWTAVFQAEKECMQEAVIETLIRDAIPEMQAAGVLFMHIMRRRFVDDFPAHQRSTDYPRTQELEREAQSPFL